MTANNPAAVMQDTARTILVEQGAAKNVAVYRYFGVKHHQLWYTAVKGRRSPSATTIERWLAAWNDYANEQGVDRLWLALGCDGAWRVFRAMPLASLGDADPPAC